MSQYGTVVNDTELKVQIYQLTKSAIRRLTGDKSVPETFCSNVADYLYDHFQEFIDRFGRMNLANILLWLGEFPIETIQ